VQLNK